MQYVELSGLVGVFIRLDVDHTGEEQVETILRAAQQQVLILILQFLSGAGSGLEGEKIIKLS